MIWHCFALLPLPRHRGPELQGLRKLEGKKASPYVFVTERKGPMTDSAFRKIVARAGVAGGIALPCHPHMLRHATGFKLANAGQDTRAIQHYLGHVRCERRRRPMI